ARDRRVELGLQISDRVECLRADGRSRQQYLLAPEVAVLVVDVADLRLHAPLLQTAQQFRRAARQGALADRHVDRVDGAKDRNGVEAGTSGHPLRGLWFDPAGWKPYSIFSHLRPQAPTTFAKPVGAF